MKFNLATTLLLIVAVAWFGVRYAAGPWPPTRLAGALICLFATSMVITARTQLGRSFSVRAKARRLVTTGLYRYLRNPIYIFGCFFFFGLALFFRSWIPVVLLALLIPMQVKRARREAAVLEAAFGDEYRQYRARTWI